MRIARTSSSNIHIELLDYGLWASEAAITAPIDWIKIRDY
jgi:hypothetical protein